MNIFDIKNKAEEVLLNNNNRLFKTILYVGCISAVLSALSDYSGTIISLVVTFATLCIEHGIYVASLKQVNNRQDDIEPENDAFIGFSQYKDLFSSYFAFKGILFAICFGVIFIGLLLSLTSVDFSKLEQLQNVVINIRSGVVPDTTVLNMTLNAIQPVLIVFFTLCIVLVIFAIYYSLKFGLYPYIVEKHNIKGVAAMKESSRLMKGNMMTLFKLELSFLGWILLSGVIVILVSSLLNVIVSGFIATLIGAILGVYVKASMYEVKYYTCLAVFYEELEYNDQFVDNTNTDENTNKTEGME